MLSTSMSRWRGLMSGMLLTLSSIPERSWSSSERPSLAAPADAGGGAGWGSAACTWAAATTDAAAITGGPPGGTGGQETTPSTPLDDADECGGDDEPTPALLGRRGCRPADEMPESLDATCALFTNGSSRCCCC